MSSDHEELEPQTPEEELPQDPGIPGRDVISHEDAPPPDEKDPAAESRERLDDPDQEGHQSVGEISPDR